MPSRVASRRHAGGTGSAKTTTSTPTTSVTPTSTYQGVPGLYVDWEPEMVATLERAVGQRPTWAVQINYRASRRDEMITLTRTLMRSGGVAVDDFDERWGADREGLPEIAPPHHAVMAAVLAFEARGDAVATGVKPVRRTAYAAKRIR